MTAERRPVRATPAFFEDLDRQLPEERESGFPSRADFQAYDLLPLIDRFATGFDDLPQLIAGRPQYRVLIARGRLIPVISAVAQLAVDGAVELVQLNLDLASMWDDAPDDE